MSKLSNKMKSTRKVHFIMLLVILLCGYLIKFPSLSHLLIVLEKHFNLCDAEICLYIIDVDPKLMPLCKRMTNYSWNFCWICCNYLAHFLLGKEAIVRTLSVRLSQLLYTQKNLLEPLR
jgi:hypothetical protein